MDAMHCLLTICLIMFRSKSSVHKEAIALTISAESSATCINDG